MPGDTRLASRTGRRSRPRVHHWAARASSRGVRGLELGQPRGRSAHRCAERRAGVDVGPRSQRGITGRCSARHGRRPDVLTRGLSNERRRVGARLPVHCPKDCSRARGCRETGAGSVLTRRGATKRSQLPKLRTRVRFPSPAAHHDGHRIGSLRINLRNSLRRSAHRKLASYVHH